MAYLNLSIAIIVEVTPNPAEPKPKNLNHEKKENTFSCFPNFEFS
jgi:hypothetical protein